MELIAIIIMENKAENSAIFQEEKLGQFEKNLHQTIQRYTYCYRNQ